ncbi:MAG: hypothetical protein HKO62_05745, partial [Gammaproteobacteria bacterium]|nr:hypothetical protein [Gammaproteobacteria bacterium]
MSPGVLLAGALAALLLGPLASSLARQEPHFRAVLDGFAAFTVGGFALLLLMPTAIRDGGGPAIVFMLIGLAVPGLLHRVSRDKTIQMTDRALVVGLAVHAAVESAALVTAPAGESLGFAVVAHRLPVGLAVFSLARNPRAGWAAIAVLVGASLAGFGGGQVLESLLTIRHDAWLQGFVAGTLLHVLSGHQIGVRHAHCHDAPQEGIILPSHTTAAACGALGGLALIAAVMAQPHGHHHAHTTAPHFIDTMLSLALVSAPALIAGYGLAGLIGILLTPQRAQWLRGGARWRQSLRGMAFGLPLPVCSCGVLPLYHTLVRRGAPATAAMAFLIATPELGLDALLLSLPLLGTELTIARLVAAIVVALGVSLLVGRLVAAPPAPERAPDDERAPPHRLRDGLRFGFVELFDHTMPWILTGLFIAALVEPLLRHAALAQVPALIQVPLFALIGIPAYVCASGATPIAAVAIAGGVSPGAALAFLIAGPATNVTTFGVLSQLHGRSIAAAFGIAVTFAAVVCGWTVDAMAPGAGAATVLHDHEASSPVNIICLALLGLLLLMSLFRQGPRGMLTQVLAPLHT